MKTFKIGVNGVREINIENTLGAWYAELGCNYVEFVNLPNGDILVVDEEGYMNQGVSTTDKPIGLCFQYGVHTIAGGAIIVGGGENGDTTSPSGKLMDYSRDVRIGYMRNC